MLPKLNCPRCGGSMAEGFIVDKAQGYYGLGKWVAGAPLKSIWTGLKIHGREQFDVRTARCGRCGYLESYARSP